MKLRSTTKSVSTLFSRRMRRGIGLVGISVLMAIGSFPVVKPAAADQYDDKIAALTQDMAKYQNEANRLNGEAASLQNTLAQIANEKNALQSQIDLNQAQSDKLTIDIATTEKEIKDNQDALGKTIADLYIDGTTSPIELLASSTNIGDFLNKQEYRSSIKTELNSTIVKVKSLKTQLDKQKTDLDTVLAEQKVARDSLVAKENEQASLLAQTQSNEANYQSLIQSSAQQIAVARATQAALNAKSNQTGGYQTYGVGLNLDYVTDTRFGVWNNANCPMVYTYMSSMGSNGNGGDNRGYGCRQCASYVAWKINQEKGYWPSWGNASNFGSKGTASAPRAGTVAVMYDGGPGHVAWVETDPYTSTSGPLKGQTVIKVSQYNFNYGQGYGMYSVMELSVNFFDTYRAL